MIERVIVGLYSIWVILHCMDIQEATNCDCMLLLPLVFVMQFGFRNLLKELQMLQAKATKIFVDDKLTLALVNNLVFHDQS